MDGKTRELGQKAMLATSTAIGLKALMLSPDSLSSVIKIKLTNPANGATVLGCAGILMTIYFVFRAWHDHLIAHEDFDTTYQLAADRKPKTVDDAERYSKRSPRSHRFVDAILWIFELLLPILLAIVAAIAIGRNIPLLLQSLVLN